MGYKYTVEAGKGNVNVKEFGTEWLVLALLILWWYKVDNKVIFWKKVTIRK